MVKWIAIADCATLLNELNELRPEASAELRVQIRDLEVSSDGKILAQSCRLHFTHDVSINHSQTYLMRTNQGRGIGFKAMGITLDMQLLKGLAAGLFTVIFPLSVFMLHSARYQLWTIGASTTNPYAWVSPYNNGCFDNRAQH